VLRTGKKLSIPRNIIQSQRKSDRQKYWEELRCGATWLRRAHRIEVRATCHAVYSTSPSFRVVQMLCSSRTRLGNKSKIATHIEQHVLKHSAPYG